MRALCRSARCALSIIVAWHSLAAAQAQAPSGQAVYRCTVEGVITFSDRPCEPAAVPYQPDTSRISTYSPPPASPTAAAPPLRIKPSRNQQSGAGRSIAKDQVRHAADCERIHSSLKDIAARMRAGYNAKQGEQLRERKAKLEQRRRARRCR
jgi:hypothetical protein